MRLLTVPRLAILAALALLNAFQTHACTIVSGVDAEGVTWVGNNEDMVFHFETALKVLPRSEGRYGGVIVTYHDGFPQGGVNEKGLFFDFNALDKVGIENYRDWDAKRDPTHGARQIIDMLQKFDNVPDAITYLDQYRWEPMLAAQMHLADARGNLAVFAGDGICYKKRYQVSTNFRVCVGDVENKLARNPTVLWRYPIADTKLKSGVSFESVRSTLADTAQSQLWSTIYSFVTNLDTSDTHLYYGADFNTAYTFNVRELVNKGEASYLMRKLFPRSPLVQLWQAYQEGGGDAALAYFHSETRDLPTQERQNLLRNLYTNLLLDADPDTLDIQAAAVLYEEWAKGEKNGVEHLFEGMFSLAKGEFERAREFFVTFVNTSTIGNKQLARRVIDRIDGKEVTGANIHITLDGHKNAKFVYITGLSLGMPLLDFLTPTQNGWAGDFKALYPDANYQVVADGEVVATRQDR